MTYTDYGNVDVTVTYANYGHVEVHCTHVMVMWRSLLVTYTDYATLFSLLNNSLLRFRILILLKK